MEDLKISTMNFGHENISLGTGVRLDFRNNKQTTAEEREVEREREKNNPNINKFANPNFDITHTSFLLYTYMYD